MQQDVIKSKTLNKEEQVILKGIPASSGICIGKTKIFKQDNLSDYVELVSRDKIDSEISRYEIAQNVLVAEFHEILQELNFQSKNAAAIIESNLMILSDEIVKDTIIQTIKEGYTAEYSIIREFDKQKQFFKKAKDDILRERAIELDHIKKRLIGVLKSQCLDYSIALDSIVVANSLTPTDIVKFKEAGVIGFVLEVGGIASHFSIMARSFNIPAIVGVKDALALLKGNTTTIVDAYSGQVIYNPKKTAISKFITRRNQQAAHNIKLGKLANVESITNDGEKIQLLSNIDSMEDVHKANMSGVDGFGLVRTESLLLELGEIPSEGQQYDWYQNIVNSSYPNPVTFRVFDFGSDKYSKGMPHQEENPALGFRGIRYLLSRKDIFETQLRAIIKTTKHKNVKIMLPMINSYSEIINSKKLIQKVSLDLIKEGYQIDEKIPIGIMIETPAAALLSDTLAKFCDFFSIGTNDLTQYTLAADRDNQFVSDIYDSFNPAVLKLIKMTADSAHKHNIDISVCGELAGHAAATSLLLGMGIKQLSVAPTIILELKNKILNLSYAESEKITTDILETESIKEVHKILEDNPIESVI